MHRFTEVLAPFEYSCFHMLVPIKTKFLLCIHIFIFSHVHIFISFGIFLKMRYPKFHFQSKCLIFRFIHKDLNIANATVYWSIGTIWTFEHCIYISLLMEMHHLNIWTYYIIRQSLKTTSAYGLWQWLHPLNAPAIFRRSFWCGYWQWSSWCPSYLQPFYNLSHH